MLDTILAAAERDLHATAANLGYARAMLIHRLQTDTRETWISTYQHPPGLSATKEEADADPVLRQVRSHLAARQPTVIEWGPELYRQHGQYEMWQRAHDFGMFGGLAIPLTPTEQTRVSVYFDSDQFGDHNRDHLIAQRAAIDLSARLYYLGNSHQTLAESLEQRAALYGQLSDPERRLLNLTLRNLLPHQLASNSRYSQTDVRHHLVSAMRKLDARSPRFAAQLARQLSLLD